MKEKRKQAEQEEEQEEKQQEKPEEEQEQQQEETPEGQEVASRRLAWHRRGVQPKSKEGKPRSANSPALQSLFRGITGLGRRVWTAYLLSRVL